MTIFLFFFSQSQLENSLSKCPCKAGLHTAEATAALTTVLLEVKRASQREGGCFSQSVCFCEGEGVTELTSLAEVLR